MLRTLRSRRRPRYGPHVCALIAALLLLFSVSLLHTRLSQPHQLLSRPKTPLKDNAFLDPLLSDSDDSVSSNDNDDKIDELDTIDEDQQNDAGDAETRDRGRPKISSSGYFFDHVTGSIRRAFDKKSIEEWDFDYAGFTVVSNVEDTSKAAFGSDDIPVDDEVRRKMTQVIGIEDALLLKMGKRVSPLREKWGEWFDKKSEFLRRDKMFKSHLEVLNPMNNPLLQDPDGVGVSGLTRGDRVVQNWWFNEFKRVPFIGKKRFGVSERSGAAVLGENGKSEIKRAERRTLNDDSNASNGKYSRRVNDAKQNLSLIANGNLVNESNSRFKSNEDMSTESNKSDETTENLKVYESKNEFSGHIYADGKTWGYYPGLHPGLSFSGFMDAFFWKGKCDMRVFMVWNSPPWMYTVRHQRGLESVLFHHRDACVLVFSETIELDFFKDNFVKDGYKVAVVMPNLDELLKDTRTHVFASVWFEWRKTKFYSTHYSELVRLAALYKYGGIYIDSDIIVLKTLSSLDNSVGLEDQLAESPLNGAVMAFRRHSPFLLECLNEFYLTYDDTRLRWNGADLLTRVARKFRSKENISIKQLDLKLQPCFLFFPVSWQNITRYFISPATESEKAEQDALFKKIVNGSLTFHFWNSRTFAIIPEPQSLVARLIDYSCIRCSDVL